MFNFTNINTIIWDWNGTLLNDAEFCVRCMNKVLKKREMRTIDLDRYKSVFTFPVKDYYTAIGFDFNEEEFEVPAMEFIDEYYKNIGSTKLHSSVLEVLEFFKSKGVKQFVLSAMEHGNLLLSLKEKGIFDYFEEVVGIDNHYAHSKVEMGEELFRKLNIDIKSTLMIGDTIHDFEVANKLNISCLLIADGHQNKNRLLSVTPNVISNLCEVVR